MVMLPPLMVILLASATTPAGMMALALMRTFLSVVGTSAGSQLLASFQSPSVTKVR